MTLKLFKETFTGKYEGVASPIGLPMGAIVSGSNMRKVSGSGGWKVRKGCTYHNTTAIGAESAVPIRSLHQYTHPRMADAHFIAQTNGKLYEATNDPPASGTTFAAAELSSLASSTQAGFSDVIDDAWVYADGSGAPVTWGGDTPLCKAFFAYDASEAAYIDMSRKVRDARSDTYALILGAATDKVFICSPLPAKGITLDLGTSVNAESVTLTVKDFNGSWNAVASMTDGTADSGKTLAVDGSITWTAGGDEKKYALNGVMGFWYELSWSGALTGSVYVISCKVQYDPARLVNKWDGAFELPFSVRVYRAASTTFTDVTGELTSQSDSMYLENLNDNDIIYIKSVEPIFAVAFGVVQDYANALETSLDSINWWNGSSWTAISTFTDGTKTGSVGFAQSGIVQWDASGATPVKRTFSWDQLPGYWYQLVMNGEATATLRIFFAAVANYPEELSAYDGVVEFKGRSMLWGDPEFPNRMRFSAFLRLDAFSGSDSGWTMPFGNANKVVCARRFFNELMVWKADSVWLLEGYDARSFGILRVADTVGCCAPATCHVVEAGFPDMHKDESLTIAIWMDTDGIYIIDGRKPKKVSLPVDHFFNPEFSTTCIAAANLAGCSAFIDKNNNEYHLLIPDGRELVYNYISDEWYPPWSRRVSGATDYLVCGTYLRGTDKRYYTYAGNNKGAVFRLENDTTDKDASNADVAISHSVKTRAICANPQLSASFDFIFRRVQLEAKARSAGTVTVNYYKDLGTTPTVLATPATPTLVNAGYGLTTDGVDTSQQRTTAFQLEFAVATADVELELWSIIYEIMATGELILS